MKDVRINILLIDNYDSFTYNLYDYFCQLGAEVIVIRNNELTLAEMKMLSFDAIVLSPGPGRPKDAGIMMSVIDFYKDKKPILGICLGHQGIGEYFGAKLKKAKLPMHGKTSEITISKDPIFNKLPKQMRVMRYHSLILEGYPKETLMPIAKTEQGELMALRHKNYPLYGIQYHPESILTENGIQLLNNWLNTLKFSQPKKAQ